MIGMTKEQLLNFDRQLFDKLIADCLCNNKDQIAAAIAFAINFTAEMIEDNNKQIEKDINNRISATTANSL